ncbi:phosphoserine phosphatase SerB [Sessilibacter corallicola]|uniref:Phosphoserine phosphatase n=1 Tax=Sessilibacter corallicola TaxID=2904075 RepID=A0ABQ0ADY2_9GAMM
MTDAILMTLSGPNHPEGVQNTLDLLADQNVNVLDMNLDVTHNHLNFSILMESLGEDDSALKKELLFMAHNHQLSAGFHALESNNYEQWLAEQKGGRFIITVLARSLSASQLAAVGKVAAKHELSFGHVQRLTTPVSLVDKDAAPFECIELTTQGSPKDIEHLRSDFLALSTELSMDIAVQADDLYRTSRRLVCFDMDSTLIEVEVIDELAKAAGCGEQVAAITEAAMRGELDFNESFANRLGTLKGLDESVLAGIAANLPITEGAPRLMATLKKLGYKTAILSGGFNYFAEYLQQKLGFDYIYANQLEIEDGKVTGRVVGDVVNGAKKAELLGMLAEKEGLSPSQVIAVGDGANDIPMLTKAGLGVAFQAKPVVRAGAKHSISTLGLDAILYLIGFRDSLNQD